MTDRPFTWPVSLPLVSTSRVPFGTAPGALLDAVVPIDLFLDGLFDKGAGDRAAVALPRPVVGFPDQVGNFHELGGQLILVFYHACRSIR
jgi:hypothetical protein